MKHEILCKTQHVIFYDKIQNKSKLKHVENKRSEFLIYSSQKSISGDDFFL